MEIYRELLMLLLDVDVSRRDCYSAPTSSVWASCRPQTASSRRLTGARPAPGWERWDAAASAMATGDVITVSCSSGACHTRFPTRVSPLPPARLSSPETCCDIGGSSGHPTWPCDLLDHLLSYYTVAASARFIIIISLFSKKPRVRRTCLHNNVTNETHK